MNKNTVPRSCFVVIAFALGCCLLTSCDQENSLQASIDEAAALIEVSQWSEAKSILDEVREHIDGDKQPLLIGKIQLMLSKVHRFLENYETAVKLAEEARSIAAEQNDDQLHADALYQLGDLLYLDWTYFYKDTFDASFEIFNEALQICENAGYQKGLAESNYRLGTLWQVRGEREKAENHFVRALEISEANKFAVLQARSWTHIGITASNRGDFATALEYHRKALQSSEPGNRLYSTALCYGNIANTFIAMEDYPAALENALKAVEYGRKTGHALAMSRNLEILARTHVANNNPTQAEAAFVEAIELAHAKGYKNIESIAEYNYAELLLLLDRPEEAAGHYGKFIELRSSGRGKSSLPFGIAAALLAETLAGDSESADKLFAAFRQFENRDSRSLFRVLLARVLQFDENAIKALESAKFIQILAAASLSDYQENRSIAHIDDGASLLENLLTIAKSEGDTLVVPISRIAHLIPDNRKEELQSLILDIAGINRELLKQQY